MRSKIFLILTIILIGLIIIIGILSNSDIRFFGNEKFVILSNEDNSVYDDDIIKFGKDNHIDISIIHKDDLEAIDMLANDSKPYDAVWLSNSTWLYMLQNVKTTNSKSININPVVFGVKKSKAKQLGFIDEKIYNKDIVNAIKDKKLSYVMSSVVKTNTGLVAYLSFLNTLAGSPEILTSEMLEDESLKNDLISFFSGVKRVSGTDDFLSEMFLKSNEYEAVIATESALININKELEKENKETLYLLYPIDGVAINDSPFAYIDNKQEKEESFDLIQKFLLSSSSQKKLETLGKRTWYGGINANADKNSFKKEWGIDTTKYLMAQKYPSKAVMDDAIALYLDEIRKPSVTAFCLDFSGSMYGNGESELKAAMNYVLDYESAKKDKIQFSKKDKIIVIPFSDVVKPALKAENGRNTKELLDDIRYLNPGGQTNLYGCAESALEEISNYSSDYMKTIILMTDGASNVGSFNSLMYKYSGYVNTFKENTPIYGIMFGNAKESELREIASYTNAKVFDGRYNLTEAFKEVRSYN